MHSAVAIAALLGAGAFAHPSFEHRHPHNKRDTFVTSTIGNEVVVEDIKDPVIVTVTAGQLPSGQPSVPLAVPEKLAVEGPPAAPLSVTPITISTQTSPSPASSTPVVAPAPALAPAASSPGSSDTFWATSPMSPLGGGSGAKDVLTQANHWRKLWKGLPPFTWSPVLANNSYMTATQPTYNTTEVNPTTGQPVQVEHNEGEAKVMGHYLYPGSSSQCIATGADKTVTSEGFTPFDLAFLMWICERYNSNIPCEKTCDPYIPGLECAYLHPTGDDPYGHADIIGGTVTQIGCYYMNSGNSGDTGLWTCDFAN